MGMRLSQDSASFLWDSPDLSGRVRSSRRATVSPLPSPQGQVGEKKVLPRLGYTIQAGAFGNPENAARLTHSLQ